MVVVIMGELSDETGGAGKTAHGCMVFGAVRALREGPERGRVANGGFQGRPGFLHGNNGGADLGGGGADGIHDGRDKGGED